MRRGRRLTRPASHDAAGRRVRGGASAAHGGRRRLGGGPAAHDVPRPVHFDHGAFPVAASGTGGTASVSEGLILDDDNLSSASLDSGNGGARTDADEVPLYILADDIPALVGCDGESDTEGVVGVPPVGNIDMPMRVSPRSCGGIFDFVEELYAFLLLRGPKPLNEDEYNIVRAGHNLASSSPLTSLTRILFDVMPRFSPWLILSMTREVSVPGSGDTINLPYILPSTHLRRDMRVSATHDLFFSEERRTDGQRRLEPDFADTPMFNNRQRVLLSRKTVHHFILEVSRVSAGESIENSFSPHDAESGATVEDALFLSHKSGVTKELDVHAGDVLVRCHRWQGAGGALVARQWLSSTWERSGRGGRGAFGGDAGSGAPIRMRRSLRWLSFPDVFLHRSHACGRRRYFTVYLCDFNWQF